MATRSAIGIKHGDVVKAVYCHWDGYLEHNGLILAQHYTDSIKVNKLISLGDLSTLAKNIEPPEGSVLAHNFDNPVDDVCVFYKRDRGEENVDYRVFANEQDFLENFNAGEEYHYLFKDGKWYYSDYGNEFTELEVTLIMDALGEANE